jgi:hypothetical protein
MEVYNEENVNNNKLMLQIRQNTACIVNKFTLKINFCSTEPNVTIQWMANPFRVLKISVSNLGLETD